MLRTYIFTHSLNKVIEPFFVSWLWNNTNLGLVVGRTLQAAKSRPFDDLHVFLSGNVLECKALFSITFLVKLDVESFEAAFTSIFDMAPAIA